MDTPTTASGPGQTGGLPGSNADPRTSELPDDQAKDTVATGDVGDLSTETDEGAQR